MPDHPAGPGPSRPRGALDLSRPSPLRRRPGGDGSTGARSTTGSTGSPRRPARRWARPRSRPGPCWRSGPGRWPGSRPGPPGPSEVLEVATFTLAHERYAIETRYIAKVVRLVDFTPVPGTPGFLGGVVNLRGEILDLIDLRAFLGIASTGLTDLSRIIVLGVERNEFGIMADAVQEVATLRVDEVFEAPASLPGSGRPYLLGVTADARVVLDGAALIRDEGLYIDQGDESAA